VNYGNKNVARQYEALVVQRSSRRFRA
jgi:hypothetical protein